MQDFRKFQVWHKAHALTRALYRGTQRPANIAEGCGRVRADDPKQKVVSDPEEQITDD